jgi:sugar lactone lactonase YvrE
MTTVPTRQAALLADGFMFPEGPRWRDGRLYVSDFFARCVVALAPDGTRETVCELDDQPSGLGFAPDGDLLVVAMRGRRLLRLHDGELHEVAQLGALAPGLANDMFVDADGGAYVGNFGSDVDAGEPIRPTTLARVDPDGTVREAARDLVFPNGCGLLPDGRTLLVAETFAFRIAAFDRAPDGTLSNRRVWADFGPGPQTEISAVLSAGAIAPDGICIDAEGAVWAADAIGTGVVRVREGGAPVERVDTGALAVYAACLGGDDGRTLHLCCAPPLGTSDPSATTLGRVLTCRVDVPAVGR